MTMNTVRISTNQIAYMIILFEIGSTPLFFLGSKAKQDAWLAMAFAAVFGLLLLQLFIAIQRKEPGLNLTQMLILHYGRTIGTILGLLYVLYFSYESMRNVRDFGEFMSMSLLTRTPMIVTMMTVLIIGAYGVYKGIEVIFRISEILLPLVVLSYAFLLFLLLVANIVHFEKLAPIMENGPLPILKAAFPDIVSFPFGQTVVFLMLWSSNSEQTVPLKPYTAAYAAVALFLIFMNAIIIAILGSSLAAMSSLPFLQAVQLISIARVFERLDVFVSLLIYIGLFMKMILFYLCAVISLASMTSIAYQRWVWPVGLLILIAAFLEPNYTYHISIGFHVSLKLFPIFQILIPVILYATMMFKKRRRLASGLP